MSDIQALPGFEQLQSPEVIADPYPWYAGLRADGPVRQLDDDLWIAVGYDAVTAAKHCLLDWLGTDTRDPIGIMALWPFSVAHYQSTWHLFDAISRRYWLPEQFIWGNLRAAAREAAILLPALASAYWINTKVTKDDTKVTKH